MRRPLSERLLVLHCDAPCRGLGRRRQSLRRSRHVPELLLLAVVWSGCTLDDPAPTADQFLVSSPIFYGTEQPTLTDLTSGEREAIGFLADGSGEVFCTATLIDPWVAVTAAHCVYTQESMEEVRFGLGHPDAPDVLIEIHKTPYHETLDVALVLLWSDATSLVAEVQPLPFNRVPIGDELVGCQVEVAGFGLTHDDSRGLRFASLQVTDVQEDSLVVNGFGARGLCSGDSGGPLFLADDTGLPMVAAVESHGDQSCVGEDNLTRLDRAAGWIDAEMEAFDPTNPSPDGDIPTDRSGEAICSQRPAAARGWPFGDWLVLLSVWSWLSARRRSRITRSER